MKPEFSRIVEADTISDAPRTTEIGADEAERLALARRFGLQALHRLKAHVELSRRGGIVHAHGHVEASLVQACVVTGDPLPAKIDAPFSVRYVPGVLDVPGGEEHELTADDCDTLPLEGDQIDLGELAAETLGLAIDPFPRSKDADAALRDLGVAGEDDTGPFVALKALKDQLEKRD